VAHQCIPAPALVARAGAVLAGLGAGARTADLVTAPTVSDGVPAGIAARP
jgi:hypothetical protein